MLNWANNREYSSNAIKALSRNKVDGEDLLSLTPSEIREELKVKSMKERKRLISDIDVLRGFTTVEKAKENVNTII